MTYYEIVWTYRGEEWSLRTHPTERAAARDFNRGPSRCHQLVHGGSLRVDRITIPSKVAS